MAILYRTKPSGQHICHTDKGKYTDLFIYCYKPSMNNEQAWVNTGYYNLLLTSQGYYRANLEYM
jgi:hypothetical protein